MSGAAWIDRIVRDSAAVVRGVLDEATIDKLVAALKTQEKKAKEPSPYPLPVGTQGEGSRADAPKKAARRGGVYAMRNILDLTRAACGLPECAALRAIVEPILGPRAFAVRGLLFDKIPEANWHVGWHQDQAIAVRERIDTPGFGPWSVKASVPHVQPPAAVLEGMLTLRIHLDACDETNGPLRVIPGSNRSGVLDDDAVHAAIAAAGREGVALLARRGDVVAMRPLVLHASSPATRPRHRRVIHIEYAAEDLPGDLRWFESPSDR